ncbi:MAG: extracellular solute-binding protein [Clostridiales bacterium]|nr:extracellular solute-binding protein [Clostridiales bacterium]
MRKSLNKAASCLIMMSVALSAFAACAKTGADGEGDQAGQNVNGEAQTVDVLSEDTLWYNSNVVNISSDPDSEEYVWRDLLGGTADKIVFSSIGTTESIEFYDLTGNLVSSVDVASEYEDLDEYVDVMDFVKIDNKIYYKIISFTNYNERTFRIGNVDIDTGEPGETKTVSNGFYSEDLESISAWRTYYPTFAVGGYMVDSYLPEQGIIFVLTDTDGNCSKIDMSQQITSRIGDVTGFIDEGDGKAIVCTNGEAGYLYIELDLNSMTGTVSDQDLSWLGGYNPVNVDGIGPVVADNNCIAQIDLATGSLNEIFNFTQSNVNRSVLTNLVPISVTEDHVVIAGEADVPALNFAGWMREPVIVVLDKADSNPNVGKTLLTIASINGEYDYALCEAVSLFNETNSEYYITFDSRYDLSNFQSQTYFTNTDDYTDEQNRAASDLSAQLSIDLLSGNGPDIIVNGYNNVQLDNPDYLIDLADYIRNNLSETDYFRGIIDSSGNNGAVYQMPLSFSVTGISAEASVVAEDQIGFDYPSYGEFVSGPCNGTDPVSCGNQLDFCIKSLDAMTDLMMADGNFNFDNEAFRELATYTHDNVLTVDGPIEFGSTNKGSYIYSAFSYVIDTASDSRILGLPTFDGRGPHAVINTSVGISAQSSNIEGCIEFLSCLTGEDCQCHLGKSNFPVSRAAFRTTSQEMIAFLNENITEAIEDPGQSSLPDGLPLVIIEDTTVDDMIALCDSVRTQMPLDPAIKIIIREEIQAYLADQKTLDETISIINDRVNTVVSERG